MSACCQNGWQPTWLGRKRDLGKSNRLDTWHLTAWKNRKNCCGARFKSDILDSCKRKPISKRQILICPITTPLYQSFPLCAYANVRKKHANFPARRINLGKIKGGGDWIGSHASQAPTIFFFVSHLHFCWRPLRRDGTNGHPAVRAARSTIHFHAAYMNINAASPSAPCFCFYCSGAVGKSLTQKLSYNMARKKWVDEKGQLHCVVILVALCACIAYISGRLHHLCVCQWAVAVGKWQNGQQKQWQPWPNAK